jgi:hypothetical protein
MQAIVSARAPAPMNAVTIPLDSTATMLSANQQHFFSFGSPAAKSYHLN